MKLTKAILIAGLFCPLAGAMDAATCGPINAEASQRLISYVVKKYKLPQRLTIRLEEKGFIGDSCYRKIRFFSVASAQFFDMTATLAPDQIFLVTGADDSRIDPILAQEKLEVDRQAGFLRGSPPSQGPPTARSTIVVFSDFQCPFCKSAAPVLRDVLKLEPADVRVVFRNYPLEFHPWAFRAALTARCAAEQSERDFWLVHDFLFEKQSELTAVNLDRKAKDALSGIPGFDFARYDTCLAAEATKQAVLTDVDLGNATGVDGTPSIYVNGRKFAGPLTVESLRGFIAEIERKQPDSLTASTQP